MMHRTMTGAIFSLLWIVVVLHVSFAFCPGARSGARSSGASARAVQVYHKRALFNPFQYKTRRRRAYYLKAGEDSDDDDDNVEENDEQQVIQDPREFQKKIRREQLDAVISKRKGIETNKKELVRKRRQGEAASAAMDLPKQPLVKTIQGGTDMIFQMARTMAFREKNGDKDDDNLYGSSSSSPASQTKSTAAASRSKKTKTQVVTGVPRWHPTPGISDINPKFRTESPVMNSKGYAGSIWRNVRKRNKPAMWRYALRTFDRMTEQQQQGKPTIKVKRTNIHYEGALLACAKLAYSDRALEILQLVKDREEKLLKKIPPESSSSTKQQRKEELLAVHVTDNMILSVLSACVRGARKSKHRAPLDAALKILESMENTHSIPVTAVHLNPLAAAYQSLGLTEIANNVLLDNLKNRIGGPEAESMIDNRFNVYDVQAKDKGSYSLLVSSAVRNEDWGGAVDALRNMTVSGVYPANRHLNSWAEISESKRRKQKPSKTLL